MEADYGNQARYLVKKPFAPLGLTSAAQNVLFQSLDKVFLNVIHTLHQNTIQFFFGKDSSVG